MNAIVPVPRNLTRQSAQRTPQVTMRTSMNIIDRVVAYFSPESGMRRARARHALRHYDAASSGRRTSGWRKHGVSADAANRAAIGPLRGITRDLIRNNGWARKGVQTIGNNVVGWGIKPRFKSKELTRAWNKWANRTACHLQGRQTFYGLERQIIDTIVQSGAALVIRHRAKGMIPLQIEVLEPDYIDLNKELQLSTNGNVIAQGIEFDAKGRRVGYWLHKSHPGGQFTREVGSRFVSAKDVLHVFREDRPGQVHGMPWYAPVVVRIHDFDDYEDALLMRQKIAACFSVFVTNVDGTSQKIGPGGEILEPDEIDGLEPGMVHYLGDGQEVEFATPPTVSDNDSFSKTNLRGIAAGIGVTYEDLTGDYAGATFSSARMARLSHYGNVHDWRWNMIIPQALDPIVDWFTEAAMMAGVIDEWPEEDPIWTPPPMPMIDPEKEGLAYKRNIRSGAMTHNEMVLELGHDPEEHWDTYAKGLETLDRLKITLDSDARRTSEQGQAQIEPPAEASEKEE